MCTDQVKSACTWQSCARRPAKKPRPDANAASDRMDLDEPADSSALSRHDDTDVFMAAADQSASGPDSGSDLHPQQGDAGDDEPQADAESDSEAVPVLEPDTPAEESQVTS